MAKNYLAWQVERLAHEEELTALTQQGHTALNQLLRPDRGLLAAIDDAAEQLLLVATALDRLRLALDREHLLLRTERERDRTVQRGWVAPIKQQRGGKVRLLR